jgi:hypothetical protein
MSHRRPDPSQAGLEQALKHALRLAVDSVEPGADGLDRIRAKIVARRRVVRTRWRRTYLGGLVAALSILWRFGEPAVIWLRYWTGAVAERFRPELGRVGWLGWLRPAAAVATGLLVVTGASWAIAALPQMILNADSSHGYTTIGSSSAHSSANHGSLAGGGSGSTGPGHSSPRQASPTCPASSTAPSGSASSSPPYSSSPLPISSSPSTSSSSPTPPASTTPTGSGSPTISPSGPATTNSPVSALQSGLAAGVQVGASGAGRGGLNSQAGRTIAMRPQDVTPEPIAKRSWGASFSGSPCASLIP